MPRMLQGTHLASFYALHSSVQTGRAGWPVWPGLCVDPTGIGLQVLRLLVFAGPIWSRKLQLFVPFLLFPRARERPRHFMQMEATIA